MESTTLHYTTYMFTQTPGENIHGHETATGLQKCEFYGKSYKTSNKFSKFM